MFRLLLVQPAALSLKRILLPLIFQRRCLTFFLPVVLSHSQIFRRYSLLCRKESEFAPSAQKTYINDSRASNITNDIILDSKSPFDSLDSTAFTVPSEHTRKPVFSLEEVEAARLARLANLGWLRKIPEHLIPYAELMRLEKPVGMLLLLLPSFWGITMAAYGIAAPLVTTVYALVLFTVGALVMRGAGCTINDIWDRNFDNKVARTVERPIASGRVSVPQAVAFLGLQCFMGLGVLLSLPWECFYLGALSLPFVFSYPLFKRFTYYPQVMISITFSWGCLLGFPAVGAPLNLAVVGPLFLSNFFWSMIYDSIYAHQDKKYDVIAKVKLTALAWGDRTKPILYGLYGCQVVSILTAGFMNSMGPFFYLGAGWGLTRWFYQIRRVDLDNPASCWATFTGNTKTGWIFWLGMLMDYLMQIAGWS